MSENLRDYRRGLALHALAHGAEPMTASELAEAMGSMSMAEGHPATCWRGIDGPSTLGLLRALENAGLVEQTGETKRDSRSGRAPPTWRYAPGGAPAKQVPLPHPPADLAAQSLQAQAPDDHARYGDLTRPQLYALLEVGDMALLEVARMAQESIQGLNRVADFAGRVRHKLVAAGLEDRLP